MMPSRSIRLVVISLVLVCTAGCDQATKHFARAELNQTESIMLPGRFLELTLAENPGAFLSLGASLPQAVRTALTLGLALGLALLLVYLVRRPALGWRGLLGLSLIWAGGVSNLIDRLVRDGQVTDFMVLRIGPLHTGVFNLADFALVAGTCIVLISLRRIPKAESPA
jgi:signal peptidase II